VSQKDIMKDADNSTSSSVSAALKAEEKTKRWIKKMFQALLYGAQLSQLLVEFCRNQQMRCTL
jgi:hypothetical protein